MSRITGSTTKALNIPKSKEQAMKMVMIVCPQDRQNDVRKLIIEHGVHAYTEIRDVIGEGETGKKFGTNI